MGAKFECLYTKKQIVEILNSYPNIKDKNPPKKGMKLYISTHNGLTTIVKSDKKSTDNKLLWLLEVF